MFELKGVSKFFGQTRALAEMDLEIKTESTTVLLGPSGCGKSTMLRLLIGLTDPTTGTVIFEGEELDPSKILEQRRKMGYVIQDGGLFPHLTARGNTTLMSKFLNWDQERIDKRLDELADLTHFPKDGLDRYPAFLSGGQQQRVSLMRALMLDPDVLLMDEPLGALDPMIRAELQTDLKDIFQNLQKTVVLVTHDLAEAGYFGDHIILLRDGKIMQVGSLDDLMNRPVNSFVERFINAQRSTLESLQEQKA